MIREIKNSVKRTSINRNIISEPILQPQIQLKLIHIQTMLMLAHLNSTYYDLNRTILKATEKMQQSYFRIKMQAFLSIKNYNNLHISPNSMLMAFQATQKKRRINCIQQQIYQDKTVENNLQNYKKILGYQQISTFAIIRFQSKIEKLGQFCQLKIKSLLSQALYRLCLYCYVSKNQVSSQKSSKIQTNDSRKFKPFKRSSQKTSSKKSFSLQKSGISKHQFFVAIKYQPQRTKLNTNSQEKIENRPNVPQSFNKPLHNIDQITGRRINLQILREKKQSTCRSSKKYNNISVSQERQTKISEILYLQKKYQKLLCQFNKFSHGFLKVIKEKQTVKLAQ